MRDDPSDRRFTSTVNIPPASGPGSGKDAWRRLAHEMLEINGKLAEGLDEQRELIADLKGELALLRQQIATRKPKGGRPRIADDKTERIERMLANGSSTRFIAARVKVSAMTVSRVRKRMELRASVTAPQ